jgi:hypothetical protein
MNKYLFFGLFLLLLPLVIATVEDYEKIEEGIIGSEPVVYNGVVIKGEGVAVTDDGKIKGYVTLPEMGVGVENVQDFKATVDGFSGEADHVAFVAGHQLGKGTRFSYNKNTGELLIKDGGRFYPVTMKRNKHWDYVDITGSVKIANSGDIKLKPGSTITEGRTVSSGGVVVFSRNLDGLTILANDDAEIRIGFDGSYDIEGQAQMVDNKGRKVEIDGSGKVYLADLPRDGISVVELDDTGNSRVSFPVYTPYSISSSHLRDTQLQPVIATLSNADQSKEDMIPTKMKISFGDLTTTSIGYDGTAVVSQNDPFRAENRKTEIECNGRVSLAIGDSFAYSSQSEE